VVLTVQICWIANSSTNAVTVPDVNVASTIGIPPLRLGSLSDGLCTEQRWCQLEADELVSRKVSQVIDRIMSII
jgi:hypothetical protein